MILPVLINIDQAEPLGGLFRIMASAGFPVLTHTLALSFHRGHSPPVCSMGIPSCAVHADDGVVVPGAEELPGEWLFACEAAGAGRRGAVLICRIADVREDALTSGNTVLRAAVRPLATAGGLCGGREQGRRAASPVPGRYRGCVSSSTARTCTPGSGR